MFSLEPPFYRPILFEPDINMMSSFRHAYPETRFPYCREIRQAFVTGNLLMMDATLASLIETTTIHYSKPSIPSFKLWWHFCKRRQINCFRPSVSSFLEFLSTSFSNVGSYSTLNTSLLSLGQFYFLQMRLAFIHWWKDFLRKWRHLNFNIHVTTLGPILSDFSSHHLTSL